MKRIKLNGVGTPVNYIAIPEVTDFEETVPVGPPTAEITLDVEASPDLLILLGQQRHFRLVEGRRVVEFDGVITNVEKRDGFDPRAPRSPTLVDATMKGKKRTKHR